MLRTRLWMGTILVLLTVGMLVVDVRLAPWYPFLLFFQVALGFAACYEMIGLLGHERRPHGWLCYGGIGLMALAGAAPRMLDSSSEVAWLSLFGAFSGLVLLAFLVEMATFTQPGRSVERIAVTLWVIAYLGLLPCLLYQIRWIAALREPVAGSVALALAIFVPKSCDIGGYTAGRLFGKHRMTPVLSPKKTWEGAMGGLLLSCLVAMGLDRYGPVPLLRYEPLLEIGFGLSLGLFGMMGDLAESLIKRDCQKKDASQVVPGFGGVLDVVDAVIFAAPVAYAWLVLCTRNP